MHQDNTYQELLFVDLSQDLLIGKQSENKVVQSYLKFIPVNLVPVLCVCSYLFICFCQFIKCHVYKEWDVSKVNSQRKTMAVG